MKTLSETIAEHPIFHGMSTKHIDKLSSHAEKARFALGHILFREDEPAFQFYLIQSGKVIVETRGVDAAPLPIEVVTAGQVLGWSWLFAPYAVHFQARVIEPTETIFLDGASLLIAAEQDSEFGYELTKRMAQVLIERLQATRKLLLEFQAEAQLIGSTAPAPSRVLPNRNGALAAA
jgi:CRP-like cAMP-binding protein